MNAKRIFTTIYLITLAGSLVIAGCEPVQLFGPTLTPTPTATSTQTPTSTPTPTPTPTATSTVQIPVLTGTPLPNSIQIDSENALYLTLMAQWGQGYIDLEWSPDGKLLAVSSLKGISIYETKSFKLVKYLRTESTIVQLAFSPDGRILALGFGWPFTQLKLWNLEDDTSQNISESDIVGGILFSPDGKLLAYSVGSNIKIIDAENRTVLFNLVGHRDLVQMLSFSPDGKFLASFASDAREILGQGYDWDGTIRVWNVQNGQNVATYTRGDRIGPYIGWGLFSGDGSLLVFSSNLRIWDVYTNKLKGVISELVSSMPPISLANGKILVTSYAGCCIAIWNVEGHQKQLLRQINVPGRGDFTRFAVSPDTKYLATLEHFPLQPTAPNVLRIWDISNGELLFTIEGKSYAGADFAHNNMLILREEATPDQPVARSHIEVWDISKMKLTYEGDFDVLDVLKNGHLIAPESGNIIFKNFLNGQKMYRLEGHNVVFFSPEGSLFATVNQKEIEIRKLNNPEAMVQKITGYTDGEKVIFSPDNLMVASFSSYEIKVWDIATGKLVNQWYSSQPISEMVFADDNRLFAVGADWNILKLWEVGGSTGWEIIGKHAERITRVAFSPDGRLLASGSGSVSFIDNKVKIWDVFSRRMVHEIPAHFEDQIDGLAFSYDRKLLLVRTRAGNVYLWGINEMSISNERTARAISTAVANNEQTRLYGPQSGIIDETRWKNNTNWIRAGLNQKNYVISVTLTYNSKQVEEWPWPYHVAFRQSNQGDYACILSFSTTGKWRLDLDTSGQWTTLIEKKISNYKPGQPFAVTLVVFERLTLVYLNDELSGVFNIEQNLNPGDVILALPLGVEYQNFSIFAIP